MAQLTDSDSIDSPLTNDDDPSILLTRSLSSNSRLNASAKEFVPKQVTRGVVVQQQQPMHVFSGPGMKSLFHGQKGYYGGGGDHEGVKVEERERERESGGVVGMGVGSGQGRNGGGGGQLGEEVVQKIVNQVEFYFSDANLATTDHLMRFISKDAEGFVPLSVVASFKKIKSLCHNQSQLAAVLRNSSKLVVSTDGKKVKRQYPITELDIEELQSRIIVAENLPEDHSYQNLMKIFSAIGCVKTIRTCQPQSSNGGASAASRSGKSENIFFINKLHAFVEYESVELAEKAAMELNNERNWRNGLRVWLLFKRKKKTAQARGRKAGNEGEGNSEEEDASTSELLNEKLEDRTQQSGVLRHEQMSEENGNDKECGRRRGRGRGRGKGQNYAQVCGRGQQYHNNRGNHIGTPPSANFSPHNDHPIANKQPPGPKMPDGTRGFAAGRGKPIVVGSGN